MISIIICSRTTSISASLQENIEKTIGAAFELVLIDNSRNEYNIFEAYNKGLTISKYPYLCFMHDDIFFHTQDWGKKVIKHFEDQDTGAIGIAGSPYVPQMAGSWWGGGLVNQYILPLGKKVEEASITTTAAGQVKNEVMVLDGIWICIRKTLFNKIRFDDKNYTGFHFYDIDICMQINQSGYKLYSVFDVLLSHYSKGDVNKNWYENALLFQKKWNKLLPACCKQLTYQQKCDAEFNTLKEFLNILSANHVPLLSIYEQALKQISGFSYGRFYFKTPGYFFKYLFNFLSAKRSAI